MDRAPIIEFVFIKYNQSDSKKESTKKNKPVIKNRLRNIIVL